MESSGEHEVQSVASWDFYRLAPGEFEKILDTHDMVIFSDVEGKLFQLAPSFFDRSKFGNQPLVFPDRVRLTVEAVHRGLPIMFLGGWQSFNGELGKGGWGRTRLQEILPVTCLDVEDLRESTEGFPLEASSADHPILAGIELATVPPILGYNMVRPRDGCPVVAHWQGQGDPALAVGQFGQGRVLAYMSDPAPHWACNFVYWDQYQQFWLNAARWLLNKDEVRRTKYERGRDEA